MGKRGKLPAKRHKICSPPAEIPCPAWLGPYGREEHARAAAELKAQGRLTSDCSQVLEGIASAYEMLRLAETVIKREGLIIEHAVRGPARNPAVLIRASAAQEWQSWLRQAMLTPATLARAEVAPAVSDELEIFKIHGVREEQPN